MYSKKTVLIIALVAVIAGCTSALYLPSADDALKQHTSLDKLIKGRELYLNKCGSCHNLYLPSNYTSAEWDPIMAKMQKSAKISDSEKELITTYLKGNSKK